MNYIYQYHTETQIIHNQKISFVPHLHDEVEIITLFHGSASLIADGLSYMLTTGDFVIIFPDFVHSYTLEKDVDVGKFIFNPETIPDLNLIFKKERPKSPVIKHEKISGTNICSLAREILLSYKSSSVPVQKAYLFLLTGKLLELCEFEEHKALNDSIIIKISDYCKQNFRSDITLTDVANALFVSKSYISHIFCSKLKINFRSYINILRINEATRLMRQDNITVTEAAQRSGVDSIRTFNRAFFKHIGTTPKEYKKNFSKDSRKGICPDIPRNKKHYPHKDIRVTPLTRNDPYNHF